MKLNLHWIYSFIIILFHVVGFIGFVYAPFTHLFKMLVPFHLLLMLGVILLSDKMKGRDLWIFIGSAYLAGFLVELIGVHTGLIFGVYNYGNTLGLKLADIPLMIGINWILVLYSVMQLINKLNLKKSIAAITGAFLLTALDFFIEPVAVKYDYWNWGTKDVPPQNYIAWFLFSLLMILLLHRRVTKVNPVGITLFIIQFLFFIALNLTS